MAEGYSSEEQSNEVINNLPESCGFPTKTDGSEDDLILCKSGQETTSAAATIVVVRLVITTQ